MSTQPHMQEARERFKKIGEGHVVRCVVFLQCSEMESDCFQIFQSQFGNPQISPFNFLSCSACWSKKQDAGMETSHAKRIFSDNVTCFWTNKCCSNRSHLPQCFIKALRFLLAWLLCFYTENPRFFLEGDIRNIPDCPGRNNSHFALENEGWNRLYKVGLRLKASESSQCCEGPAVNSAKRKKRPVVPCHLQEKKGSGLVVVHHGSSHWLYWDLYNDAVPAPIHGPKIRLCITRKHVAACFCGIWDLCKKGLGLEVSESSHCYEYLLSSPVPSNF